MTQAQQQERCSCTFSQRVLGDGCRYCQPQEYIDRLHVILEEERSEAAAPVELPEPWGACISGRIWVGKLPEHARKLAETEDLPIRWLYTADTVRQLLERKP